MSLLSVIKSIVKYKEPKITSDFEFIEDDSEDSYQPEQDEETTKNSNYRFERKTHIRKTPIKLEDLNRVNEKNPKNQKKASGNTMAPSLVLNMERMKKEFDIPKNQGVVIREFKVARRINAFILFIDGMVDKKNINDFILRPLMISEDFIGLGDGCPLDYIIDNVLTISHAIKEKEYDRIINHVVNGVTAIFFEGCEECIIIENQGYEKRSVGRPVTENVIRGPQEGFTENMLTNVTLIRRIIKNRNLIIEVLPVDKTNKTNCAVLYLKGIANPTIIKEVKRRLKGINIDFISGSGMLEELIADHTLMPFPQIITTERPDRASSCIMDGKVVIIVEGTPFVSTIPGSFFESLQSPEDFNLKWQFSTFLRYIRLVALFITFLLPGLYAAVILFHHEMIPTELLNSIVKSRENVPFPTIVEIIFMELAFELIREGGIRVPGVIGNTLGIVGGLILGQAAVQAQLASPILIIIIGVVGISSFAIPSYSMSFQIRILRFTIIIFGAFAGFYGISIVLIIILGLACNLKSFGVPFLVPIAPKTKANIDIISTLSSDMQKIRPDYINPLNRHKAGNTTKEWLKGKDGDKK